MGRQLGIFLRPHARIESLRRYLRELLIVKDERGKRLIFRYYDPRVLRVYLPTCFTQELQTVFGPIDRFLVEGEDPAALIRFGFDGVALLEEEVGLQVASVREQPL